MNNLNAIFAPQRNVDKTSDKYQFVDTSKVIQGFEALGCVIRKASQQGKGSSGKHLVRMSLPDTLEVGGSRPEILIKNSHDGTSGLRISLGVYRLVCANGLVIGSDIESVQLRHQGDIQEQVAESFEKIGGQLPIVAEKIQLLTQSSFTQDEIVVFAQNALDFMELGQTDYNVRSITQARRWVDKENTAFNVLNRIQENLIKGGVNFTGNNRRTKAVKSIDKDLKINTFLWNEAEKLIKKAA